MNLNRLQGKLGYVFRDVQLLERAVTHSSFANERGTGDNERLEFLGDAVLELAVSALLLERFPEAREGQLSRLRSRLVNTTTLARIAREIEIGAALRLGVGEDQTGGRDRTSVLADAVEALLGAVFLDAGFARARKVAVGWMEGELAGLADDGSGDVDLRWKNARSLLQERIQHERQQTPRYRVVGHEGPAHEPTFTVEVHIGDTVLGCGSGSNKREASHAAAEAALRALGEPA
ncbi:MAG: ribonuclease III [Alphaproteobacteria bacterium]|nr:ribonuclease III [Alphaproteobacteria bacterium]